MINLVKPNEIRECGNCSVCCTVMGVEEINKPPMVKCDKLNENGCGCSIYNTKPEPCNEFKCLWLHGAVGQLEDRPDQLGIMFDYLRLKDRHMNVIIAYEFIEGALSTERVKYWIKKMSEKMPIVLNYLNGRKEITGNQSVLEAIIKKKDGYITIN